MEKLQNLKFCVGVICLCSKKMETPDIIDKQNLKRKSCDISSDLDGDNCQGNGKNDEISPKIRKITDDSNAEKVQNSNLKTANEDNCEKIINLEENKEEFSDFLIISSTNDSMVSCENSKIYQSECITSNNKKSDELPEDCNNSMNPDCSIEIVEKSIPLVELSDDDNEDVVYVQNLDDKTEEGEILASFEVVDEICPTPQKLNLENHEDSKKNVDDEPLICINFKDNIIKETYGVSIIKFLQTFTELEVQSNDLNVTVKKLPVTDIPKESISKKKRNRRKKLKKELFMVDTNPSAEENDVLDVKYLKKFKIEEEKIENEVKSTPQSQSCFNCSQDHALRDCTLPKDYNRINASRQKFNNSKSKLTRYHEEEEQKYSHLKPGTISENLRNALGLRKNELPGYIYGMRVLGYPPGWLEEAKITNSSLRVFDIDGEKVKKKVKNKKGLNPDKIIEYPGYNAPLARGCRDDYKKYNVMPYSKILSKANMIRHYKNEINETDSDTSDMDLDESVEMVKDLVKQKALGESTPLRNSPSLTDLEKQKNELINQLNSTNYNKNRQESHKANTSTTTSDNNKESDVKSNKIDAIIAVKNSSLGTPILKSKSPYSRLPNPDNFMVGVSPVIDFENLPNSTGKYEKMSDVLNKVRTTLKNKET